MSSHPAKTSEQMRRARSLSRLSALVIDDELPIRRVLIALLTGLGFDVTTCGDAQEAWAWLDEHTPDLLITDWMLPGMTGPELVRDIRLSERFPGLYVILITGRADHDHHVEGLEAGADDFLAKPFSAGELRVRVRAGQRMLHLRQRLVDQNRVLESSNLAMSKELLAAGRLQRALLPSGAARVPGFETAWGLHPFGHASGDMFGVFPLDESHVGVSLVDVSGHGMAAAMLSFAVSRLLCPLPGQDNLVKRRLGRPPFYEIVSPIEVLRGVRDWFARDEYPGFYCTLIYAVLNADSGEVEWISAGHMPPIFTRGGECFTWSEQRTQTPVGLPIVPRGDDGSNRVTLAPGERVFFYSDGLVDLRGPDGLWLPDDSLETAIAQTSREPIQRSVELVIQSLRERSDRESFDDDATLVGLERRQRS